MGKYVSYAPEQGWLLPPRVIDELGEAHLVFFLHKVVETLDLSAFEAGYSDDGRPGYPPQMMLKIWLYAYATNVTSSRRIEQRLHEDLGFRFLAGGLKPDYWTLNEFRKRHPRALNDVFTLVVEAARDLGMGKLGRVAIDSTRIKANASADRCDEPEQLRKERARSRRRIRRRQQDCAREDLALDEEQVKKLKNWERRLEQIPKQLEQLRKSKQQRGSRTDPESRQAPARAIFGRRLPWKSPILSPGFHRIPVFAPGRSGRASPWPIH